MRYLPRFPLEHCIQLSVEYVKCNLGEIHPLSASAMIRYISDLTYRQSSWVHNSDNDKKKQLYSDFQVHDKGRESEIHPELHIYVYKSGLSNKVPNHCENYIWGLPFFFFQVQRVMLLFPSTDCFYIQVQSFPIFFYNLFPNMECFHFQVQSASISEYRVLRVLLSYKKIAQVIYKTSWAWIYVI